MILYNFLVKAVNFWQKHSGLSYLQTHSIYSKILESDSLVIDLGANLGQFSEAITREFKCSCYAIEAAPSLYSQLPENGLVKNFNYAISDRNEPLKFYISDNIESNSISQEVASSYGIQEEISVDGITLGAEEGVFNSTRDATLCNVKQITIEFHDFMPGSITTEEVNKITNRLKRLGFICIPFSYLLPYMERSDFLFINTNRCKIPYKDWLGFQMIKLLLTVQNTSSLVQEATTRLKTRLKRLLYQVPSS